MRIVAALGGNALRGRARRALVITHGNGPPVGMLAQQAGTVITMTGR